MPDLNSYKWYKSRWYLIFIGKIDSPTGLKNGPLRILDSSVPSI